MAEEFSEPDFSIFISHRQQDQHIAEAVATQLSQWGISKSNIFSFSQRGTGLKPGEVINDGLLKRLQSTDLFVLIYTIAGANWNYCMLELGIATGADTRKTNVVVLQFTDARPNVHTDRRLLDVRTEKDCQDFVELVHTNLEFVIPADDVRERNQRFFQNLARTDANEIERRAVAFMEAMRTAAPNLRRIDRHRLDYIQFELAPKHAERVQELRNAARNLHETDEPKHDSLRQEAIEIILDHLEVQPADPIKSVQRALDAFGVPALERPIPIREMFSRWREYVRDHDLNKDHSDASWQKLLLDDISRATELNPSRRHNYSLYSPSYPNLPLRPVIVKCSRDESGTIVYDMYLFSLEMKKLSSIEGE